jgi:hypothetical protein
MPLATITTSDNKEVRVNAASVVAVEELSENVCRVHMSSGRTFVVGSSVASTMTALGL